MKYVDIYRKLFLSRSDYSKIYRRFLRESRVVLDVPCGAGTFVEMSKQNSKTPFDQKVIGTDLNMAHLRIATDKGGKVVQADALRLPFRDTAYDAIFCAHLIEHFQPAAAYKLLVELDRVLKFGGALIIQTPLLSDHFYDDFTHERAYPPNVLITHLTGIDSHQHTFQKISSNYEVIDFFFRYARLYRPLVPRSVLIRKSKARFVFTVLSDILYALGTKKYWQPDGYTLVLKKLSL